MSKITSAKKHIKIVFYNIPSLSDPSVVINGLQVIHHILVVLCNNWFKQKLQIIVIYCEIMRMNNAHISLIFIFSYLHSGWWNLTIACKILILSSIYCSLYHRSFYQVKNEKKNLQLFSSQMHKDSVSLNFTYH